MKLLFAQIERKIMLDYYQCPNGRSMPVFVRQLELMKAKRELGKAIEPSIYKIVEFLNKPI